MTLMPGILEKLYGEPVATTLIEYVEMGTVDRDLGDGLGKMAGQTSPVGIATYIAFKRARRGIDGRYGHGYGRARIDNALSRRLAVPPQAFGQ